MWLCVTRATESTEVIRALLGVVERALASSLLVRTWTLPLCPCLEPGRELDWVKVCFMVSGERIKFYLGMCNRLSGQDGA